MRLVVLCCLLLIPFQAFAASTTLLFDQSHRQAFRAEKSGPLQLSALAATFQEQGIDVAISEQALDGRMLDNFDALVISGAFAPHSEAEIVAILDFLKRGGRLAVMVHIGQPLLPLLHKLGVDVGNRVINDPQRQADQQSIDFNVRNLQDHPLTRGLHDFTIYGGWPLRLLDQQGKVLASTSSQAWVDLNQDRKFSEGDLVSPFDVLVAGDYGRGSFVVFADDAIFQNKFLHDGNRQLAENLARWLKGSAARHVAI